MSDVGDSCGATVVCEDLQAECVNGTCQCIEGYYSNNESCQPCKYLHVYVLQGKTQCNSYK